MKNNLIALICLMGRLNATQLSHTGPVIGAAALHSVRAFTMEWNKRKKEIQESRLIPNVLCDIVSSYDFSESEKWSESSNIKNNSLLFVPCYSSPLYVSSDRLAVGSDNGYIQIVNPLTGVLVQRTKHRGIFKQPISSIVHDKAAQEIIAGVDDGTITIWDSSTYEYIDTLKGHPSGIKSLTLNQPHMVISGLREKIHFWDIKKRLCTAILDCELHYTLSLTALSEDRFVSTGLSKLFTLWDVNTQKPLSKHFLPIREKLSPRCYLGKVVHLDEHVLATAYAQNIIICDTRSVESIANFDSHHNQVCELLYHHGALISRSSAYNKHGKIRIHDMRKQTEDLQVIEEPGIRGLASDPDSTAFSAVIHPGIIKTWALKV